MWHGASSARCAIVEPIATMRVQNYPVSGIKRDSELLKLLLKLTRDLFALFVQQ